MMKTVEILDHAWTIYEIQAEKPYYMLKAGAKCLTFKTEIEAYNFYHNLQDSGWNNAVGR